MSPDYIPFHFHRGPDTGERHHVHHMHSQDCHLSRCKNRGGHPAPRQAVVVLVQNKHPGEEEEGMQYCHREGSTDSWDLLCRGEPAPPQNSPVAGTDRNRKKVEEPPFRKMAAAMGRHGDGACLELKRTCNALAACC